jgi:hypothetical protein
MRVRTRGRQLAGHMKVCEQRGVKGGLTRRRGPRRRGKDEYSKVRARKQEKVEARARVGATGIEPEIAIQRDRSVTKHPPKAAFAAILTIKDLQELPRLTMNFLLHRLAL